MRTTGSYLRYNQSNNLFYDLISVSGLTRRDHDSIQFAIIEPIYTAENATAASQLNGSLALFGKTKIPDQEIWLNELKTATELDGVRILPSKTRSHDTFQFLVSACPRSSPADLVRSVKGRLQDLIRELIPKAFRSNFHVHFFAGTCGGYERGAIRIHTTQVAGSAGASPKRRPMGARVLRGWFLYFMGSCQLLAPPGRARRKQARARVPSRI